MALSVISTRDKEGDMPYVTLKQRTYIDSQGRAVGEGNTDAQRLLGAPGARISEDAAKSIDGLNSDGTLATVKTKRYKAKVEDKAVKPDGDEAD